MRNPLWRERYVSLTKILTVIMLITLVYPLSRETVRVTHEQPLSDDLNSLEDVGAYIKQRLPENSALLLESPNGHNSHYLMFFADRSVYNLNLGSDATRAPADEPPVAVIRDNGGKPYFISVKDYNCDLIYESPVKPHYRLYSLQ